MQVCKASTRWSSQIAMHLRPTLIRAGEDHDHLGMSPRHHPTSQALCKAAAGRRLRRDPEELGHGTHPKPHPNPTDQISGQDLLHPERTSTQDWAADVDKSVHGVPFTLSRKIIKPYAMTRCRSSLLGSEGLTACQVSRTPQSDLTPKKLPLSR